VCQESCKDQPTEEEKKYSFVAAESQGISFTELFYMFINKPADHWLFFYSVFRSLKNINALQTHGPQLNRPKSKMLVPHKWAKVSALFPINARFFLSEVTPSTYY
jgi:hypothetical protein